MPRLTVSLLVLKIALFAQHLHTLCFSGCLCCGETIHKTSLKTQPCCSSDPLTEVSTWLCLNIFAFWTCCVLIKVDSTIGILYSAVPTREPKLIALVIIPELNQHLSGHKRPCAGFQYTFTLIFAQELLGYLLTAWSLCIFCWRCCGLFIFNCVWGEVFAGVDVSAMGVAIGNLNPSWGFFPTLNENYYTNTSMCLYTEYTAALAAVWNTQHSQ